MIVAERKPLEAIVEMLKDDRKVLAVGCGTCVAVCFAGGKKEVEMLGAEAPKRVRSTSTPSQPSCRARSPTYPQTVSSRGDTMPKSTDSYWTSVFRPNATNARIEILKAHPDAQSLLASLQRNLSIEQVVGLANAYFNRCDPKDLREHAPGDLQRQSEAAWRYLAEARRAPNLGGNWAGAVEALRPGGAGGVKRLASLELEQFFKGIWRVQSQVYRKL